MQVEIFRISYYVLYINRQSEKMNTSLYSNRKEKSKKKKMTNQNKIRIFNLKHNKINTYVISKLKTGNNLWLALINFNSRK